MSKKPRPQIEVTLRWGDTRLQHIVRPVDATVTVGESGADFALPVSVTGGDFVLVDQGSVDDAMLEVGEFHFDVRRSEADFVKGLRPAILRNAALSVAGLVLFVCAVGFIPPRVNAEPEPEALRSFVLVSIEGAPVDLDVPTPAPAMPALVMGPQESDPVEPVEPTTDAPETEATSVPGGPADTPERPRRERTPSTSRTGQAGLGGQAGSGEVTTAATACVNGVCSEVTERTGAAEAEPEGEGLSRAQVRSVVRDHGADVRACLATTRLLDPEASGRVRLRLALAASGDVLGVDLLEDEAGAGTCLAATVRGWSFPEAEGRTRTVLPFVFE